MMAPPLREVLRCPAPLVLPVLAALAAVSCVSDRSDTGTHSRPVINGDPVEDGDFPATGALMLGGRSVLHRLGSSHPRLWSRRLTASTPLFLFGQIPGFSLGH